MKPKLSILICSLPERQLMLSALLRALGRQIPSDGSVQLGFDSAPEPTVGAKRNRLLARAGGSHVCFVDDDDRVSERYVAGILKALESNPDCVAIEGVAHAADRQPVRMIMSPQHRAGRLPLVYRLPVGHLNPVRTALARSVCFPDMDGGEDADYAAKLRYLLKTDATADPALTLYHYHYDPAVTATHPNRGGLMYTNRFGGSTFKLEYALQFEKPVGSWSIELCGDERSSRVPFDRLHYYNVPAGLHLLHVQRRNGTIGVQFSCDTEPMRWIHGWNDPLTVSLGLTAAEGARVVKAGHCVIGGREVRMSFKRSALFAAPPVTVLVKDAS